MRKVVMVTGANGMLGREVVNRLEARGFKVADLSRKALDITNELMIYRAFKSINPSFLVNCAAYTDVAKAENEKDLAYKVNAEAVGFLAKAAKINKVRFIHISTDYVFDGKKNKPYFEFDMPNPINVYGQSKLQGEINALLENPMAIILRVSWLYGNSESSFLFKIMKRLISDGFIRVVDDQFGSPTSTKFVSKVIERVIYADDISGVYHACHDDYGSWFDFASQGMQNRGYKPEIVEPIKSTAFKSKVKRPKDTRMSNKKLLEVLNLKSFGSWKRGLSAYMESDETADWEKTMSGLDC